LFTILKHEYFVTLPQELELVGDKDYKFVLQRLLNAIAEDVVRYCWINCTQWVVK
jgi:hypothetical protein